MAFILIRLTICQEHNIVRLTLLDTGLIIDRRTRNRFCLASSRTQIFISTTRIPDDRSARISSRMRHPVVGFFSAIITIEQIAAGIIHAGFKYGWYQWRIAVITHIRNYLIQIITRSRALFPGAGLTGYLIEGRINMYYRKPQRNIVMYRVFRRMRCVKALSKRHQSNLDVINFR
ncbi:hypothetical protein THIOM_004241 [Candidatus Thiomargarita nelsonii]|uniref:Uncharacterized protein n=1 Tax=Candidatus Thiomargarita nelsonii TaxID=1003181 RepID=A0A176RWH2_9GAMM|nr:hypothetical protein THIOM_004241 [Candidatus Thiomargarita nelsonii]